MRKPIDLKAWFATMDRAPISRRALQAVEAGPESVPPSAQATVMPCLDTTILVYAAGQGGRQLRSWTRKNLDALVDAGGAPWP